MEADSFFFYPNVGHSLIRSKRPLHLSRSYPRVCHQIPYSHVHPVVDVSTCHLAKALHLHSRPMVPCDILAVVHFRANVFYPNWAIQALPHHIPGERFNIWCLCVIGKLKSKCTLMTIHKSWDGDSQWERTMLLSVMKNGKEVERPHLDVPWTCYSLNLCSQEELFCFAFFWDPLSGQCNRDHRTKNPWANKSRDSTLPGEAGGRPQRLLVPREMCPKPCLLAIPPPTRNLALPSCQFSSPSLPWIGFLDHHSSQLECVFLVYPLFSSDLSWASKFKVMMIQSFFPLSVPFAYL